MADDNTAAAHALIEAQAAEYGTYVATQPIFIGGSRAFNEGDPVPVSHVERGVVDAELVQHVSATTTVAPAPAASTGTNENEVD